MATASKGEEPVLNKRRHIQYWHRFLKTLLPERLTSQESTRVAIAFFIVASLDLLSHREAGAVDEKPSEPLLTSQERQRIRTWILSLQHPEGGFCGSPNHLPPDSARRPPRSEADLREGSILVPNPGYAAGANVAATYFGLLLLALAAEHVDTADGAFLGVDRIKTLRWLRRLQRADGSFGEVVTDGGHATGGRDMRQCYMAAAVRWMLRGDVKKGDAAWVEDIDVQGLANYIRNAQVYDGGIAESSWHEPHAGYAYCAISALYILDRPPDNSSDSQPGSVLKTSLSNLPALLRFLTHRQFVYTESGDDDDHDHGAEPDPVSLADLSLEDVMAGCNGRWNKAADTCYTWWVNGSLTMLGHTELISREPSRRFLLTQTQHVVGGFSKYPGSPPDPYHGYLGLVALSTMKEPTLKTFDSSLCVSAETALKVERARSGLLAATGESSAGSERQAFWTAQPAAWPDIRIGAAESDVLRRALETPVS